MARTALTPLPADPNTTVVPGEFLWTAADVGNGNSVASTGKEILLAWNTHGTNTYNITLFNANGFSFTKPLLAGVFVRIGVPIPVTGWRQDTDGNIWFNADNASVKFAVIRLP